MNLFDVAFVDSPNGGVDFPVYAPAMFPLPDGTWAADFSEAGWTPTAVPSRGVATHRYNGIQQHTAYAHPAVLDLKDEIDYYVMICVGMQVQESESRGVLQGDLRQL